MNDRCSGAQAIVVNSLSKAFDVHQKPPGLSGSFRAMVRPSVRRVEAVRNVTFSVDEGEILAFIGPNGAGKSTTIKMLTGILHPTSGRASVLGVAPWDERQKLARQIGSVFGQKSQLWYHLPPRDTFDLLKRIYDIPTGQYRSRLQTLSDLFELGEFMSTPVRKLSLGQRMRCEIASSLLHSPRLLFLDEPTIGLDVVAKRRIRELIREMNQAEGLTVFLTSHDVGDIEELCRRVMIINNGELILDESVSALRRDYLRFKIVRARLSEPMDLPCIPGVTLLKHKSANLKLSVDVRLTSIDEVLTELMRHGRIEDITISDPPTEQVIAGIYEREGLNGTNGTKE
ncbi:MAG: ATP-binding cassette domain-containing protein [Clostridia bacterium]|nr:ATP-binding cassette domain-containing protein [Clostridia bacterium]